MGSKSSPEAAPSMPVTLEINSNKSFGVGKLGKLDFRLTSRFSVEEIRLLKLSVHCEELGFSKTKEFRDLRPNQSRLFGIQMLPSCEGEALLEISVEVQNEEEESWVYCGETGANIFSAENGGKQVSFNIDIHDIQKFMGNDLSGLIQAGLLDQGALQEQRQEHKPLWMEVELNFERHLTREKGGRRRRLVVSSGRRVSPVSRAQLSFLEGTVSTMVEIFASGELRGGRRIDGNELVLRFLPDDESNYERNRGMSRDQFLIRPDGQDLILVGRGESGTYLNSRRLHPGEHVRLPERGRLRAGMFGLELQFRRFRTMESAEIESTIEFLEKKSERLIEKGGQWLGSLQLERLENSPELKYTWFSRCLEVGRLSTCGLRIDMDGVEPQHARLYWFGGAFYIESLVEGRLAVGERILEPREIYQLEQEETIAMGSLQLCWRLVR